MAILNYKNNLNLIRNDIISDVQAITGQPRQKIKYPEIQIDPNVFPPVAALPQVNKPTVSTRSNVSSAITNPQIYQPSNQSTITNSQMSGPPQSVTEINSQMSGPPRSVTEINSQMPARSTVSSFQQIAAASNPTIAPPNRNLQDVQNYVNNLDINTYDNDSASTISRSSNLSGTLISAVPTSATRYDYMPIQGATNELDTKIPFKRKELNKNNRNRFFNNQDVEEPDYEDYEPKVQVIEERDEEEIKESKMLHKKLLEDMFQLQLSNAKPITNKDLKNKIANIDTILKRLEKISDNQEQVKSFSKSYQQMVKQYTDFAKSNKDLQDNSTLILNKGSIPIQLGNPTTGKQSNTTVIDRPQVKIADKTGTLLPVVDQVSSDGVNTTVNMNETVLTTTDLNQTVPLEETGKRQEDSTQSIESTETNKATPVTANPVAPASVVAPAPAPAPAAVADEPAAVPLTSDKALDNLVNTTSPSTIEAAKSMPTVPYTSTSIDDHRDNVDKVDKVLPTPIPATTIPATPIPTTVSNVGSAASTISSAVAQPFVEPDYIREPDVTVPPLRQKVEQQGDSRIKSYIRDLGITKVGEMGMIKDLVTNDLMKMSPEEREDSKYFYDLMDTHHASMSKIFETMLKDAGKPAFRDYNLNLDTEQLYRKPNLWNPLRQEFDNDMKEYMQKLQKVDKSSPDYPRVKNWERILQNVQYKLHNQAKKYFNDLSLVNQHMTKLRRFPGEQSESLTLPSHSYKDPSAKSDPSTKSDSSAKSMSYSQAASTAPTNPTSSNVDKLNAFLRAPREGFKKPEVPPPTAAQTTNRSRSAAKTEPTPLLNLNRTPSTESEKAKKLVYHNNKNKSKGSRHGHGITTGEKSKFHYKQLPHLCNHEFANHPVRLGIIKKVMQNYHHENAHLQNNQQRYITNLNNLLQPLLHALEDINLDVYIQHKDKRQKENLDLMRIEKVKKKGEGIKCCHCETKKDLRVTNTAPYETCCTNCMKGKGITKNRRMINMNNTSNLAETTAPEHETLSNAYNTYLRQDDSPPENKEENNNTTPTESLWRQFVKSVPEDIRKRIGHTLSKYKTKDEFEDENFYALIKNNPLTYLDDITLCLAYLFNHRTKYHEKQDLSLLKENVKTMLMAYSEGKNVKSVNHKANIQYEKFHDFSSAYNYLKNNPSLCMTIQAFL